METPIPIELRIAGEADAAAIASLVNNAYRPSAGKVGWTHEANLVAGNRTTAEQVLALFREQSAILLLCVGRSKIVACVHVEGDQSGAYIGMLATDPEMQDQGLGKQLLFHAEAYAIERFQASALRMSVLSSRPELLAFYERRGYVLTGEVDEYPLSAGVGQPLIEGIRVLSLVKSPADKKYPLSA